MPHTLSENSLVIMHALLRMCIRTCDYGTTKAHDIPDEWVGQVARKAEWFISRIFKR